MRNLKKVMSLALALVMLVGMMVIGAGAAEFNDAKSINPGYKTAVDVMAGLNVLLGKEGNNFDPAGNIKRAEAALIVARMKLGPDVANKLGNVSSRFTDIGTYTWASGAIEYCASQGYINGRTATRFDPAGNITGLELAKIMLGAVGTQVNAATWQVDTLVAATNNGMLKGLDIDLNVAITREQAAKMAFNALDVGGTSITTTSTQYLLAAESKEFADADAAAESSVNGNYYSSYEAALAAGKAVKVGGNNAVYGTDFTISNIVITSTKKEGTLGANLGLGEASGTTDEFGNPCTIYTKNDRPLVTIATEATKEYTTLVTSGTLYTELGLTKTLNATVIVDGKTEAGMVLESGNIKDSVGGAGALIKVYRSGDKVTITVKNTYTGNIGEYNAEVKNPDGQVTTKASITVAPAGLKPGDLNNDAKFETSDYTKDDKGAVIVYTAAWNNSAEKYDLKTVKTPDSITATPTRINNTEGTFVAGGQTYGYACKADGVLDSSSLKGGQAKVLYFDDYGYVINIGKPDDVEEAAALYAVIIGVKSIGGSTEGGGVLGSTTAGSNQVALLLTDGTNTGAVTCHKDSTPLDTENGTDAAKLHLYDIVTYDVMPNGEYKLEKVAPTTTEVNGTIEKNVPAIASASGIVADNNTIFLVKKDNKDLADYDVYVGINNVANLTVTNADSHNQIVAKGNVALLVYLDKAIHTAASSDETEGLVYIAAASSWTTEWDEEAREIVNVYTHTAVIDGKVTTVTAIEKGGQSVVAGGLYSGVTYNEAGQITAATPKTAGPLDASKTGVVEGTTNTAANGIVTIAGNAYAYNDTTLVFKVNGTGITAGEIGNVKDAHVVAYVVKNVVSMVFIIAD